MDIFKQFEDYIYNKDKVESVDYREELVSEAFNLGVKIVIAKTRGDASKIAVHLLNPDLYELEDAIDRAIKDGFEIVMIHNILTWPYFSKA